VSSGVGPISGYTHIAGGRASGTRKRSSYGGGPTKASIAAREREAKAAAREADIERVAALERALVSVHSASFPEAQRTVLPSVEEVDPTSIQTQLEASAGVPDLIAATGGGEVPPTAPDPEPVDRYELMREHRKRARVGIPIWNVRDRISAARDADAEAEAAAGLEEERRLQVQRVEQDRLNGLWNQLSEARAKVANELPLKVAEEKDRRVAARAEEQKRLDEYWRRLNANDPDVTLAALEQAFADNEAPAAAIDCDGPRTTVVMQFVPPEAIVPERKPARTPTGKPTLKKRTKTEINALYLQALGSNVLATLKEAFAVAPGTKVVQMLVVRHETSKAQEGDLACIYVGEFDRATFARASGSRNPALALSLSTEGVLNLKGKSEVVSPIALDGHPDLAGVIAAVERGLRG
jgi:hypothetical protein